jgi:hypothetical protein
MTQYVINIGAIPNDGTGDPLRTAFNETNLNFDQVFAAGPVLSNIQIANNKILTTNTNGNLILAPNGTGVIQANVSIVPNLANLRNLGSSTQRWATVYSQYLDISGTLTTGDLTVNGNLTVQGNIIQVGNIVTETLTIQLANAASTANAANGAGITVGANDNIARLIYNSTGNVWTTNIGLSSVGNITAPYFFGNGSQLTGVTSSYGNANVVTLLAGFGANTISTTGNITGNFFIGNGSQLTGLPAGYANANVLSLGESGWAGNIIPSGNAVYSLGNATNQWNDLYVSNATIFMNNVPVSLSAGNVLTVNGNAVLQNDSNTSIATTGTITANVFATATSNLTIGPIDLVLTDPYTYIRQSTANGGLQVGWDGQPDNDGIAYITFNDPSAASITLWTGNANTIAHQWSFLNEGTFIGYGNINTTGNVLVGNIETVDISATGNITANYFVGNGSQLTGISANTGNVTFSGEAVIGTGTSNTVSGLYLAPDPVSLTNDLYLRVRGNILDEPTHIHFDTGNNQYFSQFIGDDNKYIQLANTGNIVINSNDAAGNSAQWIFNTAGTLTLPGGSRIRPLGANLDLFAGTGAYVNLTTSDESSSVGVDNGGGYITTAGGTWDFGTTGNLTAPGNISAVGNVTAGNISAGSGTITGGNVNGANFNGNVAFGTGTVGGSGNITGGNILTAGIVSATGNVSGNFFIGNGSQLTGISGNIANITANVISFNTAAGINVAAGQMAWNSSDGTLDIGLSYADVVLQVGQETHYVVRNDTGNIIQNGTAVYCSGVAGGSGRIEASLMTGSTDPVKFLGLATQDISNGVNGVITYFGYVRGLDTRGTANTAISVGDETWAVGDQLYVHPTAAGKLTNVEPAAPNVKICVASILIRNQTSGVLFVRPTTNLYMTDLSDVQITTPAANQFLVYAGNRWENTALDISLDTTPTLGGNLAGAGFNVSNVGNISATGNITGGNLITAGIVSATGNVSGNFFIGNGSQLTGLPATYGNANVATFLAAYGSNTITTTGNITAGNIIGNISITGNVTGTSANVTLVAGAYSWTFDNTGNTQGNLSLTGANITINNAPGGNEGAEIKWALPSAANTVLSGVVVQDVFQNGMRFFESSGNSRGLYMDLGNVPNGAGTAVGYRDIPQVSFTANTTIATTDAGRHYYSTLSTGNVLTIANNASQGFQVGAAISIINQGTGNITVAQGSGVTLYLAGNATSGNRTVATFGMATLIKVATDTWFINGTGVT